MAGLFGRLVSHHKKNKTRAERYPVLKASMAGAALVSMADDDLKRSEAYATKILIKAVAKIKIFREENAQDLYDDYIQKLQNNHTSATAEIMADIAAVKDYPEDAEIVVVMCKTISGVDRDICEAELSCIENICAELNIDSSTISAIKVPDF